MEKLWTKGTASAAVPATTFYETVALSFVIPSEAEGSAVLRIFPGNAEFYPQTKLSSRPERSVVERSAVLPKVQPSI
jgi:hypothetical protein